MKKKKIVIICAALVVCLISAGIIYIGYSNKANPSITTSNISVQQEEKTVEKTSENKLVESKDKEDVKQEDSTQDKDVVEEDKTIVNKESKTISKDDKKVSKDNSKKNTVSNDKEDKSTEDNKSKEDSKPKEDEFYDTSTRDPFAEEQHKSNVPLVLVDKDGNEREPETVYWDEERNQGTLDPNGYIPEGLPPGAVYVCDVTDEELERIKEEFHVGE